MPKRFIHFHFQLVEKFEHQWDYVILTEMTKLFSDNNFLGNICSLISYVDISEIIISAV